MFQSRNRDAFLFKSTQFSALVSRHRPFQSRNRDAFLFKRDFIDELKGGENSECFNLVIEMLFFSSEMRLVDVVIPVPVSIS